MGQHNKEVIDKMNNEPEGETVFGIGYCAFCLKATKECTCYLNSGVATDKTISTNEPETDCNCGKDEVCGICFKSKGYKVENGKLVLNEPEREDQK